VIGRVAYQPGGDVRQPGYLPVEQADVHLARVWWDSLIDDVPLESVADEDASAVPGLQVFHECSAPA
jgi:hypothetical protein